MAVGAPSSHAATSSYCRVATAPVATPEAATGDTHAAYAPNPWVETERDRLSTFAADVDTASYTYSRRAIDGGALPPAAAVRVEEFVNAFPYAFGAPRKGSPFAVVMDAAPSPFDPRHHVVRVGVATPGKPLSQRAPMNLVFLVDVSGSMDQADKLGLAKQSLRTLVASLGAGDSVALVTYAGSTEVVLPATSGAEHRAILAAIERLRADGSTAMGSGLELAYQQARARLSAKAASRVIVLSDGDANVGPSSLDEMLQIIDRGRRDGVTLSTIGFGMGNYRAELMEQLGDRGNGNNYYVDSAAAATKLFTTDLVAMLEVAAKDVKLQVDFDPTMVARYRLLGYENRAIADADFRVDTVDAGEVGVGHQVTALYEVLPPGAGAAGVDPLKYQQAVASAAAASDELMQVKLRFKRPASETSELLAFPVQDRGHSLDAATADLRFAAAVALFGMKLRGSEYAGTLSYAAVRELAAGALGDDPHGHRRGMLALVDRAAALSGERPAALRAE